MTISEGQPTLSVDPEASLRAELLGQIAAAQFDVESAIAEVMRSGADVSALANQAQSLQQLQKQIGSAGATTLISLRAEIAGAVANTQAVTQQVRGIVASAALSELTTKRDAARQTIQAIGYDIFERKIFDPYLQFTSPEDEEAYRKRERENNEAIKRELAKGTDEGSLRATLLLERQFNDAGAHGATASPNFERLRQQNREAMKTIKDAMRETPDQQAAPIANSETASDKDAELRDVMACLRSAGVGPAHDTTSVNAGSVANVRSSGPDRCRP